MLARSIRTLGIGIRPQWQTWRECFHQHLSLAMIYLTGWELRLQQRRKILSFKRQHSTQNTRVTMQIEDLLIHVCMISSLWQIQHFKMLFLFVLQNLRLLVTAWNLVHHQTMEPCRIGILLLSRKWLATMVRIASDLRVGKRSMAILRHGTRPVLLIWVICSSTLLHSIRT